MSIYGKPKSVYEVLSTLAKTDEAVAKGNKTMSKKKTQILKAECKRLAGRTIVVNNTVFSFNDDGVSEVENFGNVSLDFKVLLRMNGVSEIIDKKVETPQETKKTEEKKPVLPKKVEKSVSKEEITIGKSHLNDSSKKLKVNDKPKRRGRPKKKKE